ncbi:MAG: molybdate ABC transporter permease subunit [Dehalococcoidia bacterium]|nr:molybdate ABC transporter permease subunit [Dehalococcoidia bacterium]MCA9825828.1 molybdate ABC transporter permease subunit [Dehalococcoidia bacterium]MCA9843419.1 molybdate ABC transporter permease subunit [Dehalococcoidia bacterium]MCA9853336.1 molybdate ABC transporter permease subunit [Dehalococcoidia bacterium]
MISGRIAGRTTVALLVFAFALFYVLPFAGLVERAAEDGRTFELMKSDVALDALRLSLITSTVATVLAILLGTPVAHIIARRQFRGRSLANALIDLPIILPPTVAGVALLTAFGRRGLVGEPIEDLLGITFGFTTTAVVMAQLLVAGPFYVRAAIAGFESVSPDYERVASTLGAGEWRTFREVLLPLARSNLLAGIVLCWTRAMGELGATLLFAGNLRGETQTMPLAILQAFESRDLGLPGAIALSLMLITVALVILVALRLVTHRSAYEL